MGDILRAAWRGGFSTKSNYARAHADLVAAAASTGLITTKLAATKFGRNWLITKTGLEILNECY